MKKALMLAAALALVYGRAHATSISSSKKSVARMADSSGYPVMFNDDKPWKVFESANTTTPAQIVDEAGVAPKQGMVKRICLESAPAIPTADDNVILWDTSTAAAMDVSSTGRRIVPPLQRTSGVDRCVEINALFTVGLAVKNGKSEGSSYVYWRELGGYR